VQETWLRQDLAANPSQCTLAYWHRPLWSSSAISGSATYTAFWTALQDHGADVVLAGHAHVYERFAPQLASGVVAPSSGIRQFTVGTGGKSLHSIGSALPASEVLRNDTFGVLRLDLRATGYQWEFVPVAGSTFRDAGSDFCH
jgi:poly-gamma-glutamate capsule biosynthesis protein CapA/YwtB (metallophosphatase superfamily)